MEKDVLFKNIINILFISFFSFLKDVGIALRALPDLEYYINFQMVNWKSESGNV